jgi:hypothetical protein
MPFSLFVVMPLQFDVILFLLSVGVNFEAVVDSSEQARSDSPFYSRDNLVPYYAPSFLLSEYARIC